MIVVAIIGILAAIAVPNFIKFQARSKQSEAKQSLKGFFTSERHYFSEADQYTSDLGALGFAPERGNRYAYRSMVAPTTYQARAAVTLPILPAYQGIEVDCFKIGNGCLGQPVRSAISTFLTSYESGLTGPADTGVTTGANGAFIVEAIGTIDNDDATDDWLISNGTVDVAANPCADLEHGVGGVPVVIYNDVACP